MPDPTQEPAMPDPTPVKKPVTPASFGLPECRGAGMTVQNHSRGRHRWPLLDDDGAPLRGGDGEPVKVILGDEKDRGKAGRDQPVVTLTKALYERWVAQYGRQIKALLDGPAPRQVGRMGARVNYAGTLGIHPA